MTIFTVVSTKDMTASTGKPYKALTISDGPVETKVNIFNDFPNFAGINVGSQIDGYLEANGKYQNLKSNQIKEKPRANFDKFKSTQIAEAQANKAQSIAQAQDRSAWMWAKNNACMIYAHNSDLNKGDVNLTHINELATEIYNSEPNKPF